MRFKVKCSILALSLLLLTGCSKNVVSEDSVKEISSSDLAILQDAVGDIEEIAMQVEAPKPNISEINSRCDDGIEQSKKVSDKAKRELMKKAYSSLKEYASDKGAKDAYQKFVDALQAKEQLY